MIGYSESPEERKQRIRERADAARPNVSLTPGQAETLAKAAAQKRVTDLLGDPWDWYQ